MSGRLQCDREPDLWLKAARRLGVTCQALSGLFHERTGTSVEMAIRLSKAFGSSPEA
jgi:plasmid maintenance system antidote protein VapI